jgi:CO/xanthine dehydrogenase FAD-binding subunit
VERNGKLAGIELVRCTAVFDKAGRFAPAFDPAVTTVFEADQVLVAIGQAADLSYGEPGLRTERGFIVADKRTAATSLDGVFAGGDVTGGPATLVNAMAAGQQVATSLDAYLAKGIETRDRNREGSGAAGEGKVRLIINEDALPASKRVPESRLSAPERTLRGEDCATLPPDSITQEAFRCANCGCVAVNASDLAPALIALDAQVKTTQRTLAAEELFAAAESKTTVLAADELIEEIAIPAPPAGSKQAYLKFRIRNAIDFPIVGVAFRAGMAGGRLHDVRVVLGAVAPVPLRAREVEALLEGGVPGEALAQQAAALAVRDAQPLARNRAKVEIVKALVRKAVLGAAG